MRVSGESFPLMAKGAQQTPDYSSMKNIKEKFIEALKASVANISIGDPLDAATEVGSVN